MQSTTASAIHSASLTFPLHTVGQLKYNNIAKLVKKGRKAGDNLRKGEAQEEVQEARFTGCQMADLFSACQIPNKNNVRYKIFK